MFKKLKLNHYVSDYFWEDVKNLSITLLIVIVIGGACTLAIYHPYIID